jgi:hypothetical protein
MRTFYTGSDIEDLAASGARQLEVGARVALTDAARERAEELGIVLVVPGSAPASMAAAPASNASANKAVAAPPAGKTAGPGGTLPARPRGCQHGPLAATSSRREAAPAAAGGGAAGGPVVAELVAAVSALKKRGG